MKSISNLIILDENGSMNSIERQAVSAMNEGQGENPVYLDSFHSIGFFP